MALSTEPETRRDERHQHGGRKVTMRMPTFSVEVITIPVSENFAISPVSEHSSCTAGRY
jgi:hypothetical protein